VNRQRDLRPDFFTSTTCPEFLGSTDSGSVVNRVTEHGEHKWRQIAFPAGSIMSTMALAVRHKDNRFWHEIRVRIYPRTRMWSSNHDPSEETWITYIGELKATICIICWGDWEVNLNRKRRWNRVKLSNWPSKPGLNTPRFKLAITLSAKVFGRSRIRTFQIRTVRKWLIDQSGCAVLII